MYKRHSTLGGALFQKCHSPGKQTKEKYQEMSGIQPKEINSCEENDLETPHTHTEGLQQLKLYNTESFAP